jgi:allantoinase
MKELDLILRGGTVITHDGEHVEDIGIADEKIVALESNLSASASKEIDCTGLHIFPGLIDAHVHFNEPGRAHWEGIETGSHALAAGGGTMFFDMPLNAHPPTCNADAFDQKVAAAENKSLTDFALWGGLVPGNLDRLEELSERGVIGFKAFMSNSGVDDFSRVDDDALREGMKRCAKLGKLVAVHAESEKMTSELTKEFLRKEKTSIRDYLDSRPMYAELEAIHRAIQMARETKCSLHIVHVSSGAGVALVASAQAQGADLTCETCPHYLTLTEEDMEKLGAIAKCAPPLRPKPAQDVLWRYVASERVNFIGSDHSPSPPEMKTDKNFFKVWGGISGVQHTLPILITEGHVNREIARAQIAKLTSFNVAERFKLPKTKGRIEIGADADLALVDLKKAFSVKAKDLFYRHKQSPYVGRSLTGKVVQTILRGQPIFKNGKIIAETMGKLVKPLN